MTRARPVHVAIIGAGPAGATAALTLARVGATVTLLERSASAGWRVGETLPPAIRPLLHELGVWDAFLATRPVGAPGTLSVWGAAEPYENDFIADPYGSGWHVHRGRFDAMLAAAAEQAGASVLRGVRAVSCDRDTSGGWLVIVEHGSRRATLRAGLLIEATGRASLHGGLSAGSRTACDRLVGVVGRFRGQRERQDRDARTLIEACPDGWWYSAQVPEDQIVVAFMTHADLCRAAGGAGCAWDGALATSPHTRARLADTEPVAALRILSAGSYCRGSVAETDRLLAGDAAAAHDPLCGQGILFALQGGQEAARAAAAHLDGVAGALPPLAAKAKARSYAASVRADFAAYLRLLGTYYRRERRWPDAPFWRRRHAAAFTNPH